MDSAREKLTRYLAKTLSDSAITHLTPDASTREYFRIPWSGSTAIACVYPEPFEPDEQTYLDVTRLFISCNLPVPEVLDFDGRLGVIIQEDLGDRILRTVLLEIEPSSAERLRDESIGLIAGIQAATPAAITAGSISSKLKFDREKLFWELGFFKQHYFESLKNHPLSDETARDIDLEFHELAAELEDCAIVLCHRDFHAANLMLDRLDRLRIIDHQDARIGSVCYDLVSLLLDRVQTVPDQVWLAGKKLVFLEARGAQGLVPIDPDQFNYEFELVAVQRCLKAIGTFANQTANFNKTTYADFIPPMFEIVLDACLRLNRFPKLRQIIEQELQN